MYFTKVVGQYCVIVEMEITRSLFQYVDIHDVICGVAKMSSFRILNS